MIEIVYESYQYDKAKINTLYYDKTSSQFTLVYEPSYGGKATWGLCKEVADIVVKMSDELTTLRLATSVKEPETFTKGLVPTPINPVDKDIIMALIEKGYHTTDIVQMRNEGIV